ncbi:unnamed protein product [Adineta ricciae]|uniref:EF-hand domain-containing protein n=1 Tax=Adineta ricciae TaxID=249248 RepID=A0A814KA97_ADIRI|nr:unnamed protein product [Adineta ricciae]CAF1152872.1 unnamed protein product [Adineta ricciae]
MSKSFATVKNDLSAVREGDYSWKYLTNTYFNNSKQLNSSKSTSSIQENYYKNLPSAMSVRMDQILKAQNTNAPWLLNALKKKFHRSRKEKKERSLLKETDSNKTRTNISVSFAEELLDKPLSHDGTSGKWIVNEKEIILPLMNEFDLSPVEQFNVSRAMSSSTLPTIDDSLHMRHYQYDFQPLSASSVTLPADDQQAHTSLMIVEETEQKVSINEESPIDFSSIASVVKTYYTNSRQQLESLHKKDVTMSVNSLTVEPIDDTRPLASGDSPVQTRSKRAKSTSAVQSDRRQSRSSAANKRGKKRSESTNKKKNKSYQEHLLTKEEIELREALRIIDLDNIGFFSPSELRKILKEIGINTTDISKIERCLPLDDDGHYSIDNLIKLFLGTQ